MVRYAHLSYTLRARESKQRGQHSLRIFSMFQHAGEHAALHGPQIDKVRNLATFEIAGLVFNPQCLRSGACGEIQHLPGAQSNWLWRHALHEVSLQALLEHSEAGSTAHIGAQRESHASLDMTLHGKDPAPQRRVAAGTMRYRGLACRYTPKLAVA